MAERELALVASRGLLWTYGSTVAGAVIQIGYTAVTARAVAPSAFGAYAASQALALLFSYLSLAAVGNAVIRSTEFSRAMVATAWTLAAAGGVIAATAAVLLAPWWATIWNVHEHVELVVLAAPTILLLPASTLALALLRHRLAYSAAALVELLAAAVSMGSVGLALLRSREVWLLPLAMPISLLVSGAAACVLARELPGLGWSRPAARELGRFLAPVSGMYASHYLVTTWPQLLVGRLFGSAALGFLSRGNMLVMLPATYLAGGLSKVLFPLLTRMRDDPVQHRRMVTRLLVLVTGVSALAFGTLGGAATPLVRILLGNQWVTVAALVPVLSLGAAANLLLVLSSSVLENALQTRAIWLTQAALLAAATVVTTLLLLRDAVSLTNVLWIFASAQIAGHGVQLMRLNALGLIEVRPLISAYVTHGLLGLVVFGTLTVGASATASNTVTVSVATQVGLLSLLLRLCWMARRSLPVLVTAASLGLIPQPRRPAHARGRRPAHARRR